MCLQPKEGDEDSFTRFTSNIIIWAFHQILGHRLKFGETIDTTSQHVSYSQSSVKRMSNLATTVMASIMPVLTIFVLNIISSTNLRILVTMVFTAVFALLIATFSNAKKVEIFAATATFAAVEVVFIGSALSSK
ncbi:hypothetical protein CKAH01_18354 [Colletotrichum kahawae]|uniref:DUF6594 domain-containing protein n=1 Tax=Colletotrichum kahawae TaxID=34407 RepID=A0AAD9Y714_COLKA|nr:hypothetical protein CKAH01_18354 [Colletotrichum kahawae]